MQKMIRKSTALLALFLVGVMPTAQVHAQNASVDAAVQQLQFALTVQWDQKDSAFRNEAFKTFVSQVEALEKSGVSREQILGELKSKVLDSRAAADLDRLIALSKDGKISKEDAKKIVMKNVELQQQSGASWQGDGTSILVAAIVIAVVVLIIVAASTSGGGTVYVDSGYYDDHYYDYYDCYYDYYWDEYVCYEY